MVTCHFMVSPGRGRRYVCACPGPACQRPSKAAQVRDWCSETGVAREVAEAALAHVVKNKVEAAYARSDLLDRRRQVMEAWAAYLVGERRSAEALAHDPLPVMSQPTGPPGSARRARDPVRDRGERGRCGQRTQGAGGGDRALVPERLGGTRCQAPHLHRGRHLGLPVAVRSVRRGRSVLSAASGAG